MTRIDLHIERVILDGVALAPAARQQLHGALEARLSDLFCERQAGAGPPLAGGSAARVRATPMTLPCGDDPGELGSALADAVFDSLHRGGSAR